MEDADPEFLELSERQRSAVDRAFSRGLQHRARGGRLYRKAKSALRSPRAASSMPDKGGPGGFIPEDEGGGFIPEDDAGGFIPDDDGAGGFMQGSEEDSGSFVNEKPPSAPTETVSPTDRVPISRVSALLASLGLPSDDDVLAVFQASATGWANDTEGGSGSVGLKDWRAVCAALMTPGDDEALPDEIEGADDNDDLSSLSSDEEEFQPSDDDDDDDEEGSEYGRKSASTTPAPKRRQRRQPKVHLLPQQKELSRDIWAMLKPQGGSTLTKDEVKKWAREMGEMWSDDEVRWSETALRCSDADSPRLQTWC